MKVVILLALAAIVAALAGAGLFMLRRTSGSDRPRRMARALALRVGLSIALFLVVLLAYQMGWIEPRGVPLGR